MFIFALRLHIQHNIRSSHSDVKTSRIHYTMYILNNAFIYSIALSGPQKPKPTSTTYYNHWCQTGRANPHIAKHWWNVTLNVKLCHKFDDISHIFSIFPQKNIFRGTFHQDLTVFCVIPSSRAPLTLQYSNWCDTTTLIIIIISQNWYIHVWDFCPTFNRCEWVVISSCLITVHTPELLAWESRGVSY